MNRECTPDKESSGYLPVLDGLRAVAILCVVLSHTGSGFEKIFPGTLGVILFFVLSGFLITRQMLFEMETTGTLDIGRFYQRRILRLLPALLVYLTFFIPLLSVLGAHITPAQVASGLLYFANYYHIFIGYPLYNPLPILWSLSVEEHYYIIFPFIVLAFRKDPRKLLPLLGLLILTALFWRIAVHHLCSLQESALCGSDIKLRLHGTDMVFDCILYGSVTWMLLRYDTPRAQTWLINSKALYSAGLALFICLALRNPFFRETFRYSIAAGAFAVVIVNLAYRKYGLLSELLCSRPAIWMGKISYALYLTHFGVLITIEAWGKKECLNNAYDIALYLLVSFLLAACLYEVVEKPMMKIRRSFSKIGVTS